MARFSPVFPVLTQWRRFGGRRLLSWPILVLIVFYLYVGAHLVSGSAGVLKLRQTKNEITRLESEVKALEVQRESLEAQARRLRASGLDLDALDEQARKILNVSHPNDIVIWLDDDG